MNKKKSSGFRKKLRNGNCVKKGRDKQGTGYTTKIN